MVLAVSSKKLSSTLQVASSHAGVLTVVKVAKGQLTGLVLVDIVAVSVQESTVEKQDGLQLCKALLLAAQPVGTQRTPQAVVVIVVVQDAEDLRVDENFVDVIDRL